MFNRTLSDHMMPEGRGIRATWLHSPSSLSAEIIARVGWDCLVADMQHGMAGFDAMVALLQVTTNLGVTVIVRPTALDVALIGRLLDAGASGIICPMINNAAEAELLVSACRYAPDGTRSIGPLRARLLFGDDYVAKANAGILALAMIETARGLEAVDQIVTVPGLDGVFAGPADLALSLGCPPRLDTDDPRVVAALRKIGATAVQAGLIAGTACDSGPYVKTMHDAGYRLFVRRHGPQGHDDRLDAASVGTRVIVGPDRTTTTAKDRTGDRRPSVARARQATFRPHRRARRSPGRCALPYRLPRSRICPKRPAKSGSIGTPRSRTACVIPARHPVKGPSRSE